MRGIDAEGVSVLRGDYRGADLGSREDAGLFVAMKRLAARGCLRMAEEDGRFNFYMTDLGLLALRVSVAIPAVSL